MSEEHRAYQPASEGPFACKHCEYFARGGNCYNKKVISWAKEGKFGLKMDGMYAKVEPNACCDEFEKDETKE